MDRRFFPVVILLAFSAYGQAEWTTYTNPSIARDLAFFQGSLYAATNGGLLRVDTATLEGTVIVNTDGLPSNRCKALCLDSSGGLWVGFADGWLAQLDSGGNWKSFSTYRQSQWEINVMECQGEYLLVGARQGLSLFSLRDKVAEQNFTKFDTVSGYSVRDLVVSDSQTVNVLLEDKNALDKAVAFRFDRSNPSAQDVNDSVTAALAKNVLARTNLDWEDMRSVNLEDPAIWNVIPIPGILSLTSNSNGGLESSWASALVFSCSTKYHLGQNYATFWLEGGQVALTALGDDQCRIWTGTNGLGVKMFDGTTWHSVTYSGIASNYAFNIFKDNEGGIQITSGSPPFIQYGAWGLSVLKEGNWRIENAATNPLIRFNFIYSITRHPNGAMLYGAPGDGVLMHHPQDGWHLFDGTNSNIGLTEPNHSYPGDVAVDAFGRIWTPVLYAGVTRMDLDGVGTTFSTGIQQQRVFSAAFDTSYQLWVGGHEPPYYHVMDTAGADITWRFGGAGMTGKALCVAVDSDSRVWFGTESGLMKFSYDSLSTGGWDRYLPGEEIRGIAFAPPSAFYNAPMVFASSYNQGIRLLGVNGDTIQSITAENSGLVSNRTNGLFFDDSTGFLWIGTEEGLSAFRTELFPPRKDFTHLSLEKRTDQNGNYWVFDHLPDDSDIRIYTLDGYLVRRIQALSQRDVRWYMNNTRDARVKPGVYYYTIRGSGEETHRGKLRVR